MDIFGQKSISSFSLVMINKKSILELVDFIRPKISLFITGIAASGYLLFNPIDINLFFVVMCSFFLAVAAYTYNQVTDKKEDLLNRKKLNFYVASENANFYVAFFVLLSFIFSIFLSKLSFIFYIVGLVGCMSYSRFRIKEIFLLKNVYTALIMPMPFLVGAVVYSPLTGEILGHYLIAIILTFVVSLLGDLRDHAGDKVAGINTMAVVLGYDNVKKIAFISIGVLLFYIIAAGYVALYSLVPFILVAVFFLRRDDIMNTRLSILSSFVFLSLFLFLTRIGGI